MKNRNIIKRWSALLTGIALIWLTVSVIAPVASRIPGINKLISAVEIYGINPGAFWYTDIDIEVTDEAVFFISGSDPSSFSGQ